MSLLTRFTAYSAKPALAGAWGVVTYAELAGLVARARHEITQLKLDRPTVFGLVGEHDDAMDDEHLVAFLIALGR